MRGVMFEYLTAIELSSPAWLFISLAVPLLILAYLRKRNRRQRVVSSLILLGTLSRQRLLQRRFKPPLRFYLELIALLLLMLAAAGPKLKDKKEHIAVILDNSLSMRAEVYPGGSSESRLEHARKKVRDWVGKRKELSDYTLYVSSPRLTISGERALSAQDLILALNGVSATFASDALEAAAADLAQSGEYDRILIATDRKAEFPPALPTRVTANPKSITQVEVLTVGAPVSNIYVADVRFVSADASGGSDRAVVSLGFSGEGEVDVSVGISRLKLLPSGTESAGAKRSVSSRVFPGRISEVDFDLAADEGSGQIYKIEILQAKNSKTMQLNALREDDVAWLSSKNSGGSKVLLVSAKESPNASGLARIPALHVGQIKPERYEQLNQSDIEQYALIIFDQSAPTAAPKKPTLLIVPPAANTLFPVAGEFSAASVSSWLSGHPITSYLRFDALKAGRGVFFNVPSWTQAVVNVEKGAVVVAGESQGIRFAAVGLELLPFEGPATPAYSVLTLNLLNWLLSAGELNSVLLAGSIINLHGGKLWLIGKPEGSSERFEVKRGENHDYLLSQPGVYVLSNSALAPELGDESEVEAAQKVSRQIITVNSFFPVESATAAAVPISLPSSLEHEQTEDKQANPIWVYLIGAALALALLELLIPEREAGSEG